MADNLKQVVEQLLEHRPDRILFNGDIARAKGLPAAYEAFRKIIAPLRVREVPLHFMPGNHDHRDHLAAVFQPAIPSPVEGKRVATLDHGGVHWVFLDSLRRVNGFSGLLGPTQLDWLGRHLDKNPDRPTIVCLHHNPEPTAVGLKDADAFVELVTHRRQVKAVVFGHTHVHRRWTVDGLHFINLPAVGYRFNPLKPLGWVQARIRPGSLDLQLHPVKADAAVKSDVAHLSWR
jgi:3',5'-cyclic AMP phosphodiesterase CpdA